MSKILVVYYSRTNTTKKLAEQVANGLGADIEVLVDTKDRSGALGYLSGGKDATFKSLTTISPLKYDPTAYDLVILATPLWSWSITPAVRTYIEANKTKFKQVSFLVTRGGAGSDAIFKELADVCGHEPFATLALLTKEVVTDLAQNKIQEFITKHQ
jgi:flavodoxin